MKKILLALLSATFFMTSFYKLNVQPENQNGYSKTIIKDSNVKKKTLDAKISEIEEIYSTLNFESINKLDSAVFAKALTGFNNLKKAGKLSPDASLLSICDFSLSSTQKRLWVIDLHERKILFNSLVAHGKNTGEEFAQKFSNRESSYQSSLGFYITQSTYNGNNGFSLKLKGMDPGFNDAALQRAIVMHGADYVSEEFIKSQHRIGRSWGCPAVPTSLAKPIINTIKENSCLFIYYPDENYLSSTLWLKS